MLIPVFDGHNDILLRHCLAAPHQRDALWLRNEGVGHLDLPRMQRAGFAAGFFAIYIPSPDDGIDRDVVKIIARMVLDTMGNAAWAVQQQQLGSR